jgi:AraC-like DNA-binding protein
MELYPRQYLYLRIVRAKLFIDRNFACDIDVSKFAHEACFSKFHFIRTFKSIYGRTPHQYLTDVRIARAKEFLAAGEPVAKSCFSVGFVSVGSFTCLFKRRVGQTPRQFQLTKLRFKESVDASPLKHIPSCFAEAKGWTKNSNFREAESIDEALDG